jgi:flagellar basal body-associated protein FliL
MKMADQGEKGIKGLLMLLLALTGLIFLCMVIFGWIMLTSYGSKAQPTEAKIIEEKPEPGRIFDLGMFIVNLADEDVSRYVRCQVQMEYSQVNVELDKEIKQRDAQFKDLVNTLLNDRKAIELSTSEGKEAFRRELLLKINQSLKFGAINNIFLTTFAIQ